MLALWWACATQAADTPPVPPPSPVPPKETPLELVAIEGIVTGWKPNAMRDHSEDSFAIYDAAEVRVTSPPEHAGKLLVFYVQQPSPPELLLREKDAAVCFELRPEDLKPERQLFSGAARSLRRC
jgi:hypothetical protein